MHNQELKHNKKILHNKNECKYKRKKTRLTKIDLDTFFNIVK